MELDEKPSMEVLNLQNDAILTSGGGCAVKLLCPADTSCETGDEDNFDFCEFCDGPDEPLFSCDVDGLGCPLDCGQESCFEFVFPD